MTDAPDHPDHEAMIRSALEPLRRVATGPYRLLNSADLLLVANLFDQLLGPATVVEEPVVEPAHPADLTGAAVDPVVEEPVIDQEIAAHDELFS